MHDSKYYVLLILTIFLVLENLGVFYDFREWIYFRECRISTVYACQQFYNAFAWIYGPAQQTE